MSEPARDRAVLPAPWRRVVLLACAVIFVALALHQAGSDAPTVDEGVDVSSGVAALVHRDARMVPEHPLLPKVIAAAPALLAHPIVPKGDAWRRGDWFAWSDDFIAANEGAGRLRDVLFWARTAVIVEVLAAAALLFRLTTRWFGPDGATLATVAWLTTPYVIGLGHFAMIDMPFVLATLGICLLLARWWERPDLGRTLALGAGLGAALATRHTALVLAVWSAGVVLWRLRHARRDAVLRVAQLALVSIVFVWAVYLAVAPHGSSAEVQRSFRGLIAMQSDASAPVRLVGHLPLPLEWRAGFAYLDLTSTARASSLLGRSWDGGRWWYFPASALVKLPWWLVLGIVLGWSEVLRRGRDRRRLGLIVVGPGLALWLVLVAQPLNLGLRLAMPTVALAYLGVGALAAPLARAARGLRQQDRLRGAPAATAVTVAVMVLVAAQIGSAFRSDPHSLAWTPWPWTPAYRWVSDANLDAGQGLYELRDWATRHDRPYVAFDSTRGLRVEGGSRPLPVNRVDGVRGWVAVGVTPLMQTRRDSLAWLRAYCPVGALAGGSILVYRFDRAPVPAPGPERPVDPCFGARYSTRAR